MAWNGKTTINNGKHDADYSLKTDDIFTDENGVVSSVLITDYTNNKDGIRREYKLYASMLGSYILFHKHRVYILVDSKLF